MNLSDADLLRRFVTDESGEAFAEIVRRYLNLVYSVARRHVGSSAGAEDVTQTVFIELARRARTIKADTPLVAWLHVVSRRTALNHLREAARRRAREAAASEAMTTDPVPWRAVEPLLDEAVESLTTTDRSAILLRFFENKSLRDVGDALGISDDAAQKRVARALEELRAFLVRRGVAITAATLATEMSAHAVEIAPATLSAALLGAPALPAAAALETSRVVAMTTLQKSLAAAAFLALGGAGIYEATLLARQSSDIGALQTANERTIAELQSQRRAHESTTAQLRDVEREIDARLAAAVPRSPEDIALESSMQQWLGRIEALRAAFARRPEWNVPELQLLKPDDWFDAASPESLADDEAVRRACSRLRNQADSRAANRIMTALQAYTNAHDGQLPARTDELAPLCDPPLDPAILARYEMLRTGPAVVNGRPVPALAVRQPADLELDNYTTISIDGYSHSGSALNYDVNQAQRRFARENGGQRSTNASQLIPLMKWKVDPDMLQRYLAGRASR